MATVGVKGLRLYVLSYFIIIIIVVVVVISSGCCYNKS